MKKFFALTLAVAMVLSLASVSMAAVQVNPTPGSDAAEGIWLNDFYKYDKNGGDDRWTKVTTDKVAYGTTIYLPLLNKATPSVTTDPDNRTDMVTDADAVKGLKVSAKWEQNGSYIKSVEIVKLDGVYVLAFATTGSETGETEVLGEVTVKGKTYWEDNQGKNQKKDFESKFDVEIDIEYKQETVAADAESVDVALKEKVVFDFEDVDCEDFEVKLGTSIVAETYMKNTKKVYFTYNETEDEDILDAYVDANLEFYNCVGSFRRTATVYIDAEEDTYLYEVVDGKLVEMDAEYDEWDETFSFKTKTLGKYVVSDMKLEAAAVETAPANPSTGAAA